MERIADVTASQGGHSVRAILRRGGGDQIGLADDQIDAICSIVYYFARYSKIIKKFLASPKRLCYSSASVENDAKNEQRFKLF